jgi:hypothetical protein
VVDLNPRGRVNETEMLPKSEYSRSWFSVLRDEENHVVYSVGGQSGRTNLNVVQTFDY